MPIDLESLACAEALARTLSFAKAARSRALSAPAFGRRIAQIEQQLGRSLFLRTTRRVHLAPGTEQVMARARRLLNDAEALRAPSLSGERQVDVTLGTRHELGMSWLMPSRAELARAVPGLCVHLFFGSTLELEGAVAALRVHAAITSRLPASMKLDVEPLHREEYTLVARPSLLRGRPVRNVDDLTQHTLIDIDDSLPLASYLFRTAGALRFASVLTLGTIEAVRWAVRNSEGVAVLPRYFVQDDLKRRRLIAVLPQVALATDFFRLIFRRDAPERDTLVRIAAALRTRRLS
jgi:DNA-binding transcriptional LysR family regulator